MERNKIVFSVFMLFIFLFVSLYAVAAQKPIPEKYNFDGKLEKVDQIATFKEMTWDKVDKQAVILKSNWAEYYLLILNKPIHNINLEIGIEHDAPTIKAGYDRVVVDEDNTGPKYYMIERIYKLKGTEQIKEIKEQLKDK